MCPEFPDRFSRLHKERLVIFKLAQRPDNRVERFPTSRGAACPAVNNKPIRIFGHVWIEIVHEHPHGRFLMPALAASLTAAWGANDSFAAHNLSSRKPSGSKSPP